MAFEIYCALFLSGWTRHIKLCAGCAPITEKINMLAAVRCGEMQPIMLARTIATLDHMMKGRLLSILLVLIFQGKS